MEKKKHKGGYKKAKFDFDDSMNLLLIEGYARDGMDDKQIAKAIHYNTTHFCELKHKYPRLVEALKRGRAPLTIVVENSLYKRATGLKVKTRVSRFLEKQCECVGKDKRCPECMGTGKILLTDVELVQVTETELPPDTGAAMAWLKHHKPEKYNVQPIRIDHTSNGASFMDFLMRANLVNERDNGQGS
jgi:hypothetical protein